MVGNKEIVLRELIGNQRGFRLRFGKIRFWYSLSTFLMIYHFWRLCGPMDKAPAYGAGDCRFESCLSHNFFNDFKYWKLLIFNYYFLSKGDYYSLSLLKRGGSRRFLDDPWFLSLSVLLCSCLFNWNYLIIPPF